jgi:hypothetical protein
MVWGKALLFWGIVPISIALWLMARRRVEAYEENVMYFYGC